jgi:hypothetical protein
VRRIRGPRLGKYALGPMQGFECVRPWLEEQVGRPVRFEVEPGDEQILPLCEQRESDALPSGLDRTDQG